METLRTSSYLIPVKLESEPGKYMLIHGYTGAIDIVTESLLKKIQAAASGVDLPEDTLQALIKRGYITTRSQEEEYAYVARMAKALHKKSDILNTSFTLVVTYNCNFRCPYCYESRKDKDGIHQIVLSQSMVDKAFHAMELIQPQKELRKNVITLYGGEPFLKENRTIINYIVSEGRKRGYSFDAATNGYDLDTFADILSPNIFTRLQITMDGMKDMHNLRRIHYQYDTTFDKIVSNIRMVLEKEVAVSVRVNTDAQNIKDVALLQEYFIQKGFMNNPNFKLYSALISDNDSIQTSEYQTLNLLSLQEFMKKHKEYGTLSLVQDYGISKKIYTALKERKPIVFQSVFCGAQSNGYILDPLGNIYPCWEKIGNPKALLGVYGEYGVSWNQIVCDEWHSKDITQHQSCRKCRYGLFCSGGCTAHYKNGKFEFCGSYKKLFENAVNQAYTRWKA